MRFHDYFMRKENLEKIELEQEILMLAGEVKELEKINEKLERKLKRRGK